MMFVEDSIKQTFEATESIRTEAADEAAAAYFSVLTDENPLEADLLAAKNKAESCIRAVRPQSEKWPQFDMWNLLKSTVCPSNPPSSPIDAGQNYDTEHDACCDCEDR